MMRIKILFPLLLLLNGLYAQQNAPVFVADQTFKLEGETEFVYAFAQGDHVLLRAEELTGKKLKTVEFLQFPDYQIFRAYELDSILQKDITIPRTGVYVLKFSESGINKKVCRFTLHRTSTNAEMARLDTKVPWDIHQIPTYNLSRRSIQTGTKTDIVSLGGQVTVKASKFYTKKPVNAYQFTLPPYTTRWAYRISVGQAVQEARRKDADKLTQAMKLGGTKIMVAEPETALAAFALGLAIDMTVSTAGEDVQYALLDWDNWLKFSNGEAVYDAYIYQSGVSVDAQRRFAPLQGTYYFGLRSDNWVDDIDVSVDIEAITETPVFETEWYLEPVRP